MEQPGSELSAGVREGQVLAGKYQVQRVLGAGGMGVVVAARHLQLETTVALKFLMPEMLSNEEAVGRFAREARAAAKITNEHVARVLDVGTLDNGAPYMVMEYLEGSDLRQWLQREGPLDVEQTIEFVLQACEALAEAHGLGIVHRDLKPANLFCVVRPDGLPCVKVLDFGISKFAFGAASSPALAMTRTAVTMGSPFYMSPEQMESARTVDARTDIWALGIVLYELLSGQPPFTGETLPEVCLKIATKAPAPIRGPRPDVPEGLENVILRCLEKDRDRRYESVAAMAVDIMPFAPARAMTSIERITRTRRQPMTATAVAPSSRESFPSARGFRSSDTMGALGHTKLESSRKTNTLTVVAGALIVMLGVGIAFIAMQMKREAHVVASPASATSILAAPVPPPPTAAPPVAEPIRPQPVEVLAPVPIPDSDVASAPTYRPPVYRPSVRPPFHAPPSSSAPHGHVASPPGAPASNDDPFSRLSAPM